jgi:hypothetical protein
MEKNENRYKIEKRTKKWKKMEKNGHFLEKKGKMKLF